jgi:hypothetical protein
VSPAACPETVPGASLWREVTGRAGGRCECSGGCGRQHATGQGRCLRENGPRAPLHAVPRDPGAPSAAALAASALHALCDPCHAALAVMRARARRDALDALRAAETLF